LAKERVLSVDGRTGLGGAGRPDPGMGMRWYRFLLIILIFAGLADIANGIQFVTGLIYTYQGLDAAAIYAAYPMIKIYDVIYGIVIFILVVFRAYVWWLLKGMKKKAPFMILFLHGVSVVPNVIYNICCGFAVGRVYGVLPEMFANIAGGVALVSLSYIYFSKRKHLFVN
jgi:hypothetical protein